MPLIPDSESYIALYFTSIPDGIFNLMAEQNNTTDQSTSGFETIGKFFNISSDMLNGSFNSILIFSYDDTDDNGIVDGTNINENSLDAYFYNGAWVKIMNSVKDVNGNYIAATVDHFTLFALLSNASSTAPSIGSNPSGSSSSSGSSGGGGGTTGTVNPSASTPSQAVQCQPNWSCTDWSSCTGGFHTRKCNDLNSCGINEPSLIQKCSTNETNMHSIPPVQNPSATDLIIVILVLAVAFSAIFLISKRKARRPRRK